MRILRYPSARPVTGTALTLGNFDGVHLGHRAMLSLLHRSAREQSLRPCVMTFEPHPREFFAPDQAPARLTSLREKLELLALLQVECAYVQRFDFDFARITAEQFVERVLVGNLNVRWLLVGDDFRFGAQRRGDIGMLRDAGLARGFEVAQMESVTVDGIRVSSTAVRERLGQGDLAGAARLLGRPYSITGRVVSGDGLGRQLGFPTANVQMKHNRPALFGIFVVEVSGCGPATLPGVASLGTRPTVKQAGTAVLEVHLFDFTGDLYGKHLQVRFLDKLRDEETYSDLETLKLQIGRDAESARAYFKAKH